MSYTNYTGKILGIKGVKVTKVKDFGNHIEMHLNSTKKHAVCPCCGARVSKIHDYRSQKVKDLSLFDKKVLLVLRKRRFKCSCGKQFTENYSFLPRYHRYTQRLMLKVLEDLKQVISFTDVSKRYDMSITTVLRIFDVIKYPTPTTMPTALSIDEFKGNTWGEKYQVILTDAQNKQVIDILPERFTNKLSTYFKEKDRSNTKYFISDMWKPFKEVQSVYFKNSYHIVDKYHYVRQVIWAFEKVRKAEQKRLSTTYSKSFKRSKAILIKRYDKLDKDGQLAVNVIKKISYPIAVAHYLKEEFFNVLREKDSEKSIKLLSDWILMAQDSELTEFISCANTLCNWSNGICNSIKFSYSNGFTEGCNNKIKVLKRNAYGYKNFNRFRNRILHIFSNQYEQKAAV